MPRDTIYIVRPATEFTSLCKADVLEYCGITADKLTFLEKHGLILSERHGRKHSYSQETVDQIHNIIVLERLFQINPKSIKALYKAFQDYVLTLPITDKDLYKYTST